MGRGLFQCCAENRRSGAVSLRRRSGNELRRSRRRGAGEAPEQLARRCHQAVSNKLAGQIILELARLSSRRIIDVSHVRYIVCLGLDPLLAHLEDAAAEKLFGRSTDGGLAEPVGVYGRFSGDTP